MSKISYRDGRYHIDGAPYFVIASDYMYFRDRRDHWADRLTKLKQAGVNTITTYIPWRHHLQVQEGRYSYDFTGKSKDSRDVVTFLETIRSLGLWMILKPGPFVHSELNVGGLPDLVCPSFHQEIAPARRHHGKPAYWTYDASQLPAPFEERFDTLVKEWFEEVRRVILPFADADGPLIGIQLVDETIYCTSNDPPWHIGYEPSGIKHYHHLLEERYRDIGRYNDLHATDHPSFETVSVPKLSTHEDAAGAPSSREDVLLYVDWAEYQWRYRRDLYERYKQYLAIDVTHLTNFAGITPPIEENVPDLQSEAVEDVPADYKKLYPEWWFAMNRVDQDLDVHEYGLISWLGVAAYDPDVFDRYINTAIRARGINMEENWGFAVLYDQRSKHPVIPFFQTLVTVAGGATGYDIFVGVSSDYWDDSLDRITKLQHPTFPSDAPIDEHGNLRPLYHAAKLLNNWFAEHGDALLHCKLETDCAYLLYAPYAAISSWIPDDRYWNVKEHEIPRCGHRGFEEFSKSCQGAGYSVSMFELEAATTELMSKYRGIAMHTAFFMGQDEQKKIAHHVRSGGRIFLSGELPSVDLEWKSCTVLKDAVESALASSSPNVVYRRANLFADGRFPDILAGAGLTPSVVSSDGMRAFVHRHPSENEYFVFFFNFDESGSHEKIVEFDGRRLDLTLGSKTCGVLRIRDERLVAYLVKGANEVEGVTDTIRIRLGDQVVEERGDFSSCG